MKKLAFVFGAMFMATSLFGTSSAHYFYQTHDHHDLAVRPHTERVAPIKYYQQFHRDYYRCGATGCQSRETLQAPQAPHAFELRNQRPTDPALMTRYANTYQDRYLIIQEGDYVDRLGYDPVTRSQNATNYATAMASSGSYAIAMPGGFSQTSNGEYRGSDTSLAYRVLSLGDNRCTVTNFWTCGQTYNQAFRQSSAFAAVQNVVTEPRWNQTEHETFDYFPTITESFDAVVNGVPLTYYIYTALNPLDNTLMRIEAVSQRSEKTTASERAFQIFETFRFQ